MPRDGSTGVYTQPFPNVVPGTAIASNVYNGFTSDVATDLNTPRPIVAGGTGVTSVNDFIAAFGTEIAKQAVTNYGSHDFQAGSFYSLATATDSPVAGHTFAGFCTPAVFSGDDSLGMFIEARDMDDGSVPPRVYIRQKIAGVWGTWMTPATGGVDPDFSGMISINARHFATNDATKTYILTPSSSFPSAGAAITLSDTGNTNSYQADTHSFITRTGGIFVERFKVTATAANFTVPLATVALTTTAPASTDSSTRVPDTAWVRANATDAALTTGWPMNSRSADYTLVLSDAGRCILHPASDSTPRTFTVPLNTSVAFPVGTLIYFVNMGGTVTITNSNIVYIAGAPLPTASSHTLTSNRGLATILKVNTGEWIMWGEGLT